VEPALSLGNQLRLEGAIAVAWSPQVEVAHITADGLLRMSLATVLRSEATPRFARRLALFWVWDRKCLRRSGRNLKAGRTMATPRFTAEELQELHTLAARWAQIVSKRLRGRR